VRANASCRLSIVGSRFEELVLAQLEDLAVAILSTGPPIRGSAALGYPPVLVIRPLSARRGVLTFSMTERKLDINYLPSSAYR
jgi:hypothetical protein